MRWPAFGGAVGRIAPPRHLNTIKGKTRLSARPGPAWPTGRFTVAAGQFASNIRHSFSFTDSFAPAQQLSRLRAARERRRQPACESAPSAASQLASRTGGRPARTRSCAKLLASRRATQARGALLFPALQVRVQLTCSISRRAAIDFIVFLFTLAAPRRLGRRLVCR